MATKKAIQPTRPTKKAIIPTSKRRPGRPKLKRKPRVNFSCRVEVSTHRYVEALQERGGWVDSQGVVMDELAAFAILHEFEMKSEKDEID